MADSREYRSKFIVSSLSFLGILFGILVAVYFLGGVLSGAKLDLTQDGLFTISEPTKQILDELTDDITVRYYCSEEVPSSLATLKRDTIDMFRELEGLSGGHFKYEVIAPEEKAREHASQMVREYFEAKAKGKPLKEPVQKESIEDLFSGRGRAKKTDEQIREERRKKAEILAGNMKGGASADDMERQILREEYYQTFLADLQNQGIYPVPVQEREGSSVKETSFYTALEIKYLTKTPEVIPLYHQFQGLEYELASKILKLTRKAKPKVVFFDGRKPEMPPMSQMNPMMRPPQSDYSAIIQALGELFDIDEVSLKEGNSLSDVKKRIEEDLKKTDDDRAQDEKPDRISCLIVAQPHELEARQVFEISQAVSEGIPTIFLVSGFSVDVSQNGLQNGIPITFLRHGLDDLFRSWGVTMGKDIIASRECATIPIPQRIPGTQMAMQMPHPMPVLAKAVREAINQSHALTNRIQTLVFPAAVGLNVNEDDAKKAGLEAKELANSGRQSYTVQVSMFEQDMFNRAQPPSVMRNKELVNRNEHKDGFSGPRTLAALVTGKFPFKYQDQPIPDWKKEDKDKGKAPGDSPFPGLNLPGPDGSEGPQGPQVEPAPPAPESPAPEKKAEVKAEESKTEEIKTEEKKEPEKAPEKAPEKVHLELKTGNVVILTSADMMKNSFLLLGGEYQPNVNFFHNAIETFGLDDRLLQIRRKELTDRHFKSGSGEGPTRWIQAINIGILPAAVGVLGLVRFLVRRRESNAYERQYQRSA